MRATSIRSIVLVSAVLTDLSAQQAVTTIPKVVRVTSTLVPADGGKPAPVEGVTLSIYRDEREGAPLWQETQNVSVDSEGRYSLAANNVSDGNSNNIHIGSVGASGDSGTIRIGTPSTQTSFFAAGIRGVTTGNNNAIEVVRKESGIYRMWYCYRGQSYRIGYAESMDGISWVRKDEEAGMECSETGWNSQMQAYPWLFRHREDLCMLYNGNAYGETGFGLAIAGAAE